MKSEKYNLAEAQEEAEKLQEKIETGDASNYEEAEKLVEQEDASKKERLISLLRNGDVYDVLKIKEQLNLTDDVIQSLEVQEAAKEGLIGLMKGGRIDAAIKIKEQFNLPDNVVQEVAVKSVVERIRNGDVRTALQLKDEFNLPDDVFQSSEVQEAAKRAIAREVSGVTGPWWIERALRIKEGVSLPDRIFQEATKEQVLELFKRGMEISSFLEIKEKFNLPDDILQSPEVQDTAKRRISFCLEARSIESALEIQEQLNLPDEIIWEAAKERIAAELKFVEVANALKKIDLMKEELNLPDDILQSPEVQEAAKEKIVSLLKEEKHDALEAVLRIKNELNLRDDIIQSLEVQEAAKETMLNGLRRGNIDDALKIKEQLNLPDDVLQSPKAREAVKSAMIGYFQNRYERYVYRALRIKNGSNLSNDVIQSPEIQEAAKTGIVAELNWGEDDTALENIRLIKKEFDLSDDLIQSSEVQEAAKKRVVDYLKRGLVKDSLEIKKWLSLSDDIIQSPEVQEAVKGQMIDRLKKGYVRGALTIRDQFNLSSEAIQSPEVQEAAKEGLIFNLKEGEIEDAFQVKDQMSLPEEYIQNPEVQKIIRAARALYRAEIEGLTEDELKEIFNFARQEFPPWRDGQVIAGSFQEGAEIFGYKKMIEYTGREGLTLHDSLHAFRDILELFKSSGLGESEFYGQILYQVMMDDRGYPEGTAHHHLNAIAQTANKNIAEVIARVQEYNEIEKLQELAAAFNAPRAVFASWANLKRYSELEQLLGQTEIFDELKDLKAEGKEKLYRYVETLAFHPDSKVNMDAVIQFWRNPESFLAADASHTPHEVHDKKKPSNYLHMPHLDLTAPELRDALVEGKMDSLSVFTPLEIRYTFPLGDVVPEPLPDLVHKALGSNKEGIQGVARNPRKLFSELGKLLKPYGVSVVEYIQGKSLPEGVNLSQDIEALLYSRDFGMKRFVIKIREFVARINQKSDPEGAIAGDDTVNCMPFGDGKNTVYTFNPNTAQFVVRVVTGEGKERTIAQSVLTKDVDTKTPVPDIVSELQQEGKHLEDILPADVLISAPVYAACDNVEVAPNYSDERHQQILEIIYRDFFREYMNRYAKTERLNTKEIPIGRSTDALSNLPTRVNTFVPQAPVSYSDKMGDDVYVLNLESNEGLNLIQQKQIKEIVVEGKVKPSLPKIKGLDYLTFEDSLKVAYLEGKAYSDNQSLMQFLFNMENGLIAKDINNAAKDRPNMSLKYTDENGRARGYMLAWEGRLSDENVEYNAGDFFNQPCLYIADIATDRESHTAGGRLIQGFVELYKQNYLDKGKAMPIFAQAREATSYQIVKRQLDRLGKDAGFNFELVELPTYEVGGDVMHPIIIKPTTVRG